MINTKELVPPTEAMHLYKQLNKIQLPKTKGYVELYPPFYYYFFFITFFFLNPFVYCPYTIWELFVKNVLKKKDKVKLVHVFKPF